MFAPPTDLTANSPVVFVPPGMLVRECTALVAPGHLAEVVWFNGQLLVVVDDGRVIPVVFIPGCKFSHLMH